MPNNPQEEIQSIRKRVKTLDSERAKWLETTSEMGKRLTGFDDLDELVTFVVEEINQRLNAETTALFWIERKRLRRKAIAGVDADWFPDETYEIGEGITGQVIRSKQDSKYGNPVRTNNVESHPLVISNNLMRYQDRLATHTVQHLLAVPMNGETGSLGVLRVVNRLDPYGGLSEDGFSQDDEDFLVTIASMVAIAIENNRLLMETKQHLQEITTLNKVVQRIAQVSELSELLKAVVDETQKTIPNADKAIIHLIDEISNALVGKATSENNHLPSGYPPLTSSEGIAGKAIQTKKTVYVPDTRKHSDFLFRGVELSAILVTPLTIEDEVIGTLSVDSEHQIDAFSAIDRQMMEALAANAAIAIYKARLIEKQQEQMKELDKLYQVSKVVTSSLDMEKVLRRIVTLASDVAGSDHTGVVLVDESDNLITSVEDHEVGAPLHSRARSDGVTRQIIGSLNPVFAEDIQSDSVLHNPSIINAGYRSYAGLPIIAFEQLWGVLFVHSFQTDIFRNQASLLKTFCNHAAIAIRNAKLYHTAIQETAMLQKMVDVSSGLISHIELDELLDFCVQCSAEIFNVEDCSIYLIKAERQTIDLAASSAIPPHIWTKRDSRIKAPGLTAYVARTGETLNFGGDSYRDHPSWGGHGTEPFLKHLEYLPSKRCQSLLISPLEDSQGISVGVLKLENKRGIETGRRFRKFEEVLFKTLASHIGVAIERAGLYQRLDAEARREARQTLGFDLHEIMNFVHGALVMRLAIAAEKMEQQDFEGAHQEIRTITKAARGVHTNLRWIHNDLRSDPILEDKGLIPALENLSGMLRLPVEIVVSGRYNLPLNIEYALYKIGVEGLTNITKHAGVEHELGNVNILLDKSEGCFKFCIKDNGIGFEMEPVLSRNDNFGIHNMKRWAQSINGKIELESKPQQGTCIQVTGSLE